MSNQQESNEQGMEPSIMGGVPKPGQEKKVRETEEETYTPKPEADYSKEEYSKEESQQQSQEQDYPQPSQESYDNYDYASSSYNSDVMIEIAEQVFQEKTKKIQKQISEINEFKTLAETKIENISERLKRIETMIDKLQISILEKVGSYGNNLETTKKEMGMMQDSFRKVMNSENKRSQKK